MNWNSDDRLSPRMVLWLFFTLVSGANAGSTWASEPATPAAFRETDAEMWVGIDGLGRQLPVTGGNAKQSVPLPKPGKVVGMFYFVWLDAQSRPAPFDIEQILQQPEDKREWGPVNAFHWWGQPRFGYYRSDDRWVFRQHAFLLNDLGVDVIFIDVTNALTYDRNVAALFETFEGLRREGQKTPQVAFLANSHAGRTVEHLLEQWYRPKKHQSLWFLWKEKPLILMPFEEATPEMREVFEIRQSWAWSKGQKWFGNGQNRWPWLDHTPQAYGWKSDPTIPEQISVAVAEHPVSNIGRSFSRGKQPPEAQQRTTLGLHYAEQWERALAVDPELVFITGWNEWIAQRFVSTGGQPFLGRPTQPGETFFVDQFSAEFSRDIEPAAGPLADHYYYQTMAEIRRYKGARPPKCSSSPPRVIDVTSPEAWKLSEVAYLDDLGDAPPRRSPSWVHGEKPLENPGGWLDIDRSAVAFDGTSHWVRCDLAGRLSDALVRPNDSPPANPPTNNESVAESVLESTVPLQLWLDLDNDPATGPCGFERIVNVEALAGGEWRARLVTSPEPGDVAPMGPPIELKWITGERHVAICLPKDPAPRNAQGRTQFRWKWHSPLRRLPSEDLPPATDLGNSAGNPFLAGDSAPNGRLGYLYRETPAAGEPRADE